MGDFTIYILLALVVILTVIVCVVLSSLSKLKGEVNNNNKQSELMQQRNIQSMADMQQNINAMQNSMQQSVQGLQTAVQQTLNQSYSSLNQNLDNKLQGSFDSIQNYLQTMNKDLGEMKSVANGIDDVKKVLSNVKTRGILGEIQLGAILSEILSPLQYEENIATIPGSSERVEFAVKLPGNEDNVYLPIDSKFPGDAYAHLVDAYNIGDETEVKLTRSKLMNQFRNEAKDISTKYLKVPYTTDFAIMFLPFEGLYAEAVNMGAIEILQKEFNVVIAGPSTMAALLNSLQMGFRTLAIQQNAENVWKVLGNVKAEFEKFAAVLDEAQTGINKVNKKLDELSGVRTRQINRALKSVEKLEGFSEETAEELQYLED